MKCIIYDFGANNGDDIPYYLLKSDLVVAVEVNPKLCSLISERFPDEIRSGRLVVENYVLSEFEGQGDVEFYIHKTDHVVSQFPEPMGDRANKFTKIRLPSITPGALVEIHGWPHYVKIDLENYDANVLRNLFLKKIFPKYISCEAHTAEAVSALIASGEYNAFKVIDGYTVSKVYEKRSVRSIDGTVIPYSFPFHSAGPFGEEVDGDWVDANGIYTIFGIRGFGWKDVHATKMDLADVRSVKPKIEFCKHVVSRISSKIKPASE